MSTILHVGVIDGPHGKDLTTGDLAEILEGKYALFSQFVDLEFDNVDAALAEDYENQLYAMINGLPVGAPFAEAGSKLTAAFKRYLDTEEIVKSGVPGVPTAAALAGKNSRLKMRRGPRRPSFIDTSVLRTSLIVWVESDDKSSA